MNGITSVSAPCTPCPTTYGPAPTMAAGPAPLPLMAGNAALALLGGLFSPMDTMFGGWQGIGGFGYGNSNSNSAFASLAATASAPTAFAAASGGMDASYAAYASLAASTSAAPTAYAAASGSMNASYAAYASLAASQASAPTAYAAASGSMDASYAAYASFLGGSPDLLGTLLNLVLKSQTAPQQAPPAEEKHHCC